MNNIYRWCAGQRSRYGKYSLIGILTFLISILSGANLQAQFVTKEASTVSSASIVLNEIMSAPLKSIPQAMLADAHGIAIIPNVLKGGLVVGVRHGKGVLCLRDRQSGWQPPQFVSLTGGSVGFQLGVNSTDVILVFKTAKSIEGLMTGKFTVGGDAAVAAGPVGREAAVATDGRLQAEIYSYARGRGLFAGVSLDGSILEIDPHASGRYYYGGRPPAGGLQSGQPVPMPASAVKLIEQLTMYSPVATTVVPPGQSIVVGSASPGTGNTVGAGSDALRASLAGASRRLQSRLDKNWKQFLALPADVYTFGNAPNVKNLEESLARYEQLDGDPKYRPLTSHAEFRSTRDLLRQYVKSLKSSSGTISLPPPPAAKTGARWLTPTPKK